MAKSQQVRLTMRHTIAFFGVLRLRIPRMEKIIDVPMIQMNLACRRCIQLHVTTTITSTTKMTYTYMYKYV